MAKVKPFKAIRPVPDKVHLISTRSYISYTKDQLINKLKENPYSFIQVLNPDYQTDIKTPANSDDRFKRVRAKFDEFVEHGYFLQDSADHFYVYKQVSQSQTCIGIIGGASISDYQSEIIKIHEKTLTEREEIFKEYLDICEINAEPVLMAYEDHPDLSKHIQNISKTDPIYDFTTVDGSRHIIWKSDQEDNKKIIEAFEKVKNLYIADGHHRSASSALLQQKYQNHPNKQWFMSYFVSDKNLLIKGYNRIVKATAKTNASNLLEQLEEFFTLERIDKNKPASIKMYFGDWYELVPKTAVNDDFAPIVFDELVIKDVFGIEDTRLSKSIKYYPEIDELEQFKEIIETVNGLAGFVIEAMSFQDLKKAADNKISLPPKSTWIEPKLRSAITIYSLK